MSIKEEFEVYSVPFRQVKPWLLKKHYAQRMPSISYAFGLYEGKEIVGVCTFGVGVNYKETEAWKPYDLYELNRLITEDDLPKNTLSYFVSKCLKMMPSPCVIISYADSRVGHHGYIYQATNWIYTGIGGSGQKEYEMRDGKIKHQRSLWKRENPDLIDEMIETGEIVDSRTTSSKYRYYYFVGNKREKKKMKDMLRFEELPYPKGENENYDTGKELHKQQRLF